MIVKIEDAMIVMSGLILICAWVTCMMRPHPIECKIRLVPVEGEDIAVPATRITLNDGTVLFVVLGCPVGFEMQGMTLSRAFFDVDDDRDISLALKNTVLGETFSLILAMDVDSKIIGTVSSTTIHRIEEMG